tara:strand:- start:39036 stop:40052 length:1017 start_codon:yes stop_codon:yes gene_type:complete
MAVLFMDSCDHLSTVAQLDDKYDPASSASLVIAAAGRFGGTCYEMDNDIEYLRRDFPSTTTMVMGCSFRMDNANVAMSQFDRLMSLEESALQHISIGVHYNRIRVNLGSGSGATIQTTLPMVKSEVWHHLEWKVFLSATVGTVEVWLDGLQVMNETGQDTTNGGVPEFTQARWFGQNSGRDVRYDDLFLDSANLLGESRVDLIMPDGDGNYTELGTTFPASPTTHWDKVEELTPDSDTSYNNGTAVNQRDTFTMENLTAITTQTIHAVQQFCYAKHDGSATNFSMRFRISGTDYAGTSQALAAAYAYLLEVSDLDPNAGPGAWTETVINALESGYEEL